MTRLAGYATVRCRRRRRPFASIARTRMRGVPILNAALEVEAVGFAPWDATLARRAGHAVVHEPRAAAARRRELAAAPRRATSIAYRFPAGVFEFIGGREPAIGEYQACSLFSPMFEFADHDAARLTAQAALLALFDRGERRYGVCAARRAGASAAVEARIPRWRT